MPRPLIYENNNVLGDSIGYLHFMGCFDNSFAVVNNARQSYAKSISELKSKDVKLLKYLIAHEHTAPYRSVIIKLKVKAPLFLVQQWKKHIIASSFIDDQYQHSEQSLRYVDLSDKLQFYKPKTWRKQDSKNHQASSGKLETRDNLMIGNILEGFCDFAESSYKTAIELGGCREQARLFLPQNTYTTFINTISFQAAIHFIALRKASGAQGEINSYANALQAGLEKVFPVMTALWLEWLALRDISAKSDRLSFLGK